MADLTTYQIVPAGTAPTFTAAAALGDTASAGDGRSSFLVVRNAGVGTPTVTITPDLTLDSGDAYPPKVVTVPASGEVWVPLINDYVDPDTGRIAVTYSAETNLTVAVVRR